jgi:thioredoxin reductase
MRALFTAPLCHAYLQAVPGLRLTADFSHLLCVHESNLSDQPDAVEAIIAAADHIHARVGFCEGPQVSDPRNPNAPNTLEYGDQVSSRMGDGEKVEALVYTDRLTGDSHRIDLEGIFVQIGLVPNTEWLKGPLQLSPRGEIEVDAHNATNIPGVFAAGDVTTVPYKQIIVAMGEGTKAALSAFDHIIRH